MLLQQLYLYGIISQITLFSIKLFITQSSFNKLYYKKIALLYYILSSFKLCKVRIFLNIKIFITYQIIIKF